MYLYAQRELSTNKLDLIWEFLNEPASSMDCPTEKELKQYFVQKLEHDVKYNDDYVGDETFEY